MTWLINSTGVDYETSLFLLECVKLWISDTEYEISNKNKGILNFWHGFLNIRIDHKQPQVLRHLINWTPHVTQTTVASMIIVHDYGVSSEKYSQAAKYFCDQGIQIYCLDLKGHGQNRKENLDETFLKTSVEEFCAFVELYIEKNKTLNPLVILSEGLGSLIVLRLMNENKEKGKKLLENANCKGIIFISPSIKPISIPSKASSTDSKKPFALKKTQFVAMKKLTTSEDFYTSKFFPNSGQYALLQGVCDYQRQLQAESIIGEEPNTEVSCSVLQVTGELDNFSPVKAQRDFFDKLNFSVKSLKVYKGLGHDILLDDKEEQVCSDISNWVLDRVA